MRATSRAPYPVTISSGGRLRLPPVPPRAAAGNPRDPSSALSRASSGPEVRTAGLLAGSLRSGLFRALDAFGRLTALVGRGFALGGFGGCRCLARTSRQRRLQRLHQVDDL